MNHLPKRIRYIDIAKGIAIICIILGHLGSSEINRIVYTFHVPIFFLISGYFFNDRKSIKEVVKSKAKTLLAPYAFTCGVIILLATLEGMFIGNPLGNARENFVYWVYASIYGAGDYYSKPFTIPAIGAIWFLWALFWSNIFFRASLYFNKYIRIFFIAALFWTGYNSPKLFWFPFSIQAGACATLYVYIGYLFKNSKDILQKLSFEVKLFCVLSASLAWINFIKHFQAFWMVHSNFGNGINDIFSSICACGIILLISKSIDLHFEPIAKPLSFFGNKSIIVLFIHILELDLDTLNSIEIFDILSNIGIPSRYNFTIFVVWKLTVILSLTWLVSRSKFIKKIFSIKE